MIFRQKKKLFECDPTTLSVELLICLQRSLIAKLLMVNRELNERSRSLVELSEDLDGVEDVKRMFIESAERVDLLNDVLSRFLANEMARDKPA